MKRIIGTNPDVPISPAVQCGPLLFLSGQVPTEADGSIPSGIKAQTDLVLRKLEAVAKEAGYGLKDFVKCTVFLRNLEDFADMNSVYRKYFPVDPPARSCVRAEVAIAADIEIEAIAMKAP
jgi:2-iminobutanoate/2-iminopropanoate deaminase